MNTLSFKIGFYTSILLTVSFAAWIICFAGIASTTPLFRWTDLSGYLTFVKGYSQVFQNVARFFMLVFGPLYVILINCFYDHAQGNRKVLARASLLFGLGFAVEPSLFRAIERREAYY